MNRQVRNLIAFGLLVISCGPDTDLPGVFGLIPGKATLIFPENNSECTEGRILSDTESEVTFLWGATDHTTGYEVRLVNLLDGSIELHYSTTNELAITLWRGTPYSWSVISKNSSTDRSGQSEVWSFYNAGLGTVNFIPFPAEVVSPANGAQIPSSQENITLDWDAADLDDDLKEFDVYFGTSSTPPLYLGQLSEDRIEGLEIESGSTYYWRIITRDLAGNESNSGLFSFSVEEAP
jgi:hypothetical protein